MAALKALVVTALALVCLSPALAQPTTTLDLFSPITGQLEPNEAENWSFIAPEGAALSFLAQATSGDLDPQITIRGSNGAVVIGNDDYNYPATRNALLEAVTIPRLDTYTVNISGYGGTAGDYTLTMLAGFAEIGSVENFNGDVAWEMVNEATDVSVVDGELTLTGEGPDVRRLAVNADVEHPDDYYAQVAVNIAGQEGWITGLTARQNGDEYYLLSINERGQWRFSLHTADGDTTLRDWTPHPAIVPGNGTFTLGMMVNGSGFDFFYNGQLIGRLADSSLASSGQIGLVAETPSSLTARVTARFDDLYITIPALVDGERIIPDQIIVSTPNIMVQELQRRGLIPSGGEMALTVSESFVELRRPGVERLLLGRGTTFENFAIGTTATWQAQASGITGCGLVFRAVDDTHYTLAYVDQTGSYGVAQREGDSFMPGLFREQATTTDASHHLLVVARNDDVLYFVDGYRAGQLVNPAQEGAVGNAVVNFEPISTSCQFGDTWLWRWTS